MIRTTTESTHHIELAAKVSRQQQRALLEEVRRVKFNIAELDGECLRGKRAVKELTAATCALLSTANVGIKQGKISHNLALMHGVLKEIDQVRAKKHGEVSSLKSLAKSITCELNKQILLEEKFHEKILRKKKIIEDREADEINSSTLVRSAAVHDSNPVWEFEKRVAVVESLGARDSIGIQAASSAAPYESPGHFNISPSRVTQSIPTTLLSPPSDTIKDGTRNRFAFAQGWRSAGEEGVRFNGAGLNGEPCIVEFVATSLGRFQVTISAAAQLATLLSKREALKSEFMAQSSVVPSIKINYPRKQDNRAGVNDD